jgi:hypothetical protein
VGVSGRIVGHPQTGPRHPTISPPAFAGHTVAESLHSLRNRRATRRCPSLPAPKSAKSPPGAPEPAHSGWMCKWHRSTSGARSGIPADYNSFAPGAEPLRGRRRNGTTRLRRADPGSRNEEPRRDEPADSTGSPKATFWCGQWRWGRMLGKSQGRAFIWPSDCSHAVAGPKPT